MLQPLEITLIIVILGGLVLLQARTRTGSLAPYVAVVILLLILIVATRIIRFLVGAVIALALVCVVLLWKVMRSS